MDQNERATADELLYHDFIKDVKIQNQVT